jgi:predicted PurR-regulated permease PerM
VLVPPERLVGFKTRSVVNTALTLVGLALALWVVWISRQVLTWVLVSIFLALALNPAVEWLQRRGVGRRGAAAAVIYLAALAALVGLGFLLIPPIIDQVGGLADAVPGYVKDLTAGRGPLGFLEKRYHVVERVQHAVNGGGGGGVLAGGASTALTITKSVITVVVAVVTIAFMTFFMILEGPTWMDRAYGLAPSGHEQRWRAIGSRIAQTVSGYVTGNLFISLVAGAASALVLFLCGVPFALALGFLVAVLDLVPLAGATIAGIIIVTVALLTSLTAGVIVAVFFIVYQQVENHLLQPLVYGRTVVLSPLAVLISVLVGAQVAGILGALGAIPVAGAIQIVLEDWRAHRPRPPGADTEDVEEAQPAADYATAAGDSDAAASQRESGRLPQRASRA